MTKYILSILLLSMFGCAENNDNKSQVSEEKVHVSSKIVDFSGTDSLELYEYADPANQKEYSVFGLSDDSLINELVKNASSSETTDTMLCPHYRKIYLFRKEEVFKTLYISDSCNYLAYSVDGNRIFKKLNSDLKQKLSKIYFQHRK